MAISTNSITQLSGVENHARVDTRLLIAQPPHLLPQGEKEPSHSFSRVLSAYSKLESRSSRLKLTIRLKPYSGPTLARGIKLLYRRNKSNGSWVVKASDGHGNYWTKAFSVADDFCDSDGQSVLTFYEAQDRAKQLARGGDAATSDAAPISLDEALNRRGCELEIVSRRCAPLLFQATLKQEFLNDAPNIGDQWL